HRHQGGAGEPGQPGHDRPECHHQARVEQRVTGSLGPVLVHGSVSPASEADRRRRIWRARARTTSRPATPMPIQIAIPTTLERTLNSAGLPNVSPSGVVSVASKAVLLTSPISAST